MNWDLFLRYSEMSAERERARAAARLGQGLFEFDLRLELFCPDSLGFGLGLRGLLTGDTREPAELLDLVERYYGAWEGLLREEDDADLSNQF